MAARLLAIPVLALVLVALAAGCGGKSDGSTSTPVTTTATPELEGASTAPVVWGGGSTTTALLTDVRAARHEGYDRIVFAFRNALPGYDVRYVERPVVEDGSGEKVAVKGGAVLRIRMEPALDADLTKEGAPATYTGPKRFSPDTAVVAELARTGGFEAVLTWVAGLDEKRPFRVTRLEQPARIVIDVVSS